MSKWHLFIVFVLLIILGVILWIAPPSELLDINSNIPETQQLRPDSYLINSKTTQYDEAGNIAYTLNSDNTRYFEVSAANPKKYARLDKPRLISFDRKDTQQAPWKASSEKAVTLNNEEELLMTDNVTLSQIQKDGSLTKLSSDSLLFKPNQQYAETDKPVMIETSTGVTTATGLTISLDTNTIMLLSNVRSRYESH